MKKVRKIYRVTYKIDNGFSQPAPVQEFEVEQVKVEGGVNLENIEVTEGSKSDGFKTTWVDWFNTYDEAMAYVSDMLQEQEHWYKFYETPASVYKISGMNDGEIPVLKIKVELTEIGNGRFWDFSGTQDRCGKVWNYRVPTYKEVVNCIGKITL